MSGAPLFESEASSAKAESMAGVSTLLRPPLGLLSVGFGVAVLSAVLLPVDTWWTGVLGYAMSTFIGLGAVAAFSWEDVRRRQSVWYSPDARVRWQRPAVALACVGVAGCHAWVLAHTLAERLMP